MEAYHTGFPTGRSLIDKVSLDIFPCRICFPLHVNLKRSFATSRLKFRQFSNNWYAWCTNARKVHKLQTCLKIAFMENVIGFKADYNTI